MSIYVGDKKAKLYRGDYGPAQFYKGDVKIAGYTDVEKVGTSISGVDTYNDQLNPTIEGLSEQTITTNSPSPDYPSPIRSSENFDVVSCGRDPSIATTAHVTDPLRSVGKVSDSIEVSEGKVEVVRRVAVVISTRETGIYWYQYMVSIGKKYICMYSNDLSGKRLGPIFCTHDKQIPLAPIGGTRLGIWPNDSQQYRNYIYWGIEYSLIGTNPTSAASENETAFSAWLSAQASAGTPVIIQYILEEPTRIDITTTPLGRELLALRTQPHYTQVYTNATLPPTLRARIKELEL